MYFLINLYLILSICLKKNKVARILNTFHFIYFLLGFLPLSEYRGEIGLQTYLLYLLIFIAANLIFSYNTLETVRVNRYQINQTFKKILYIHLFIVYSCLFLIYLSTGSIITNPSLKFEIAPILDLVVKSSIIIPIVYHDLCPFRSQKKLFLIALIIIANFLIWSRGNILLLFMFFGLDFIFRQIEFKFFLKRNLYRIFTFCLLAVSGIYIGFYLRRNGIDLVSPEVLVRSYFDYDNIFIYIILPLNIAFKETVGLTNYIIEKDFANTFFDYPFLVAELFTVLPGHQESPGIILSQYLSNRQNVRNGLTPGLIGASFIDLKCFTVLIPCIIFFFLRMLHIKSIFSQRFIFLVLGLSVYMHLFHRGFLKAEYFVYFIIAIIYFIFSKSRI